MVDNFIAGDIAVSSFTVSSSRGTLDLTYSFVRMSIFESIFQPGIVAEIMVLDTDDQLGTLKIVGDETVNLSIIMPDDTTTEYVFAMHTLENSELATHSLNSKTYMLRCVSEEALQAKTNFVQKSYNGTLSEAVKDIHKNYLKSNKPINVEDTKGSQNIVIPHFNPYKAIDFIRRRSISSQNKSSSYVYFETRDNGKQSFTFSTIEKLFQQPSVKKLYQSDAVNSSVFNKPENNIISLEIPKVFNTIDRIKLGGTRSVKQFEYRTHNYIKKDIITDPTQYKTGGTGAYDSAAFAQKYFNAKNKPQSVIPADTSQRANTHIPDNTADLQSYISVLLQNSLEMTVYGDFNLKPGSVIDVNVPKVVGTTSARENDEMLSGKFLITRIHHDVGLVGERPRYTCVVECIKGNLENGV
jgi:hypothetical protein